MAAASLFVLGGGCSVIPNISLTGLTSLLT